MGRKRQYDWQPIQDEWVFAEQDIALTDLAKKHGLAYRTVYKRYQEDKWQDERDRFIDERNTKVRREVIRRTSAELMRSTEFLESLRIYYKRHCIDPVTGKAKDSLTLGDIKVLTEAMEKNIRTSRLLIGENTEKIGFGNDEYDKLIEELESQRKAEKPAEAAPAPVPDLSTTAQGSIDEMEPHEEQIFKKRSRPKRRKKKSKADAE